MNQKQAIKIAIDCITGEQRSLRYYTFDANVGLRMSEGIRTPHQRTAIKQVERLNKAIKILEGIPTQGRLF